MTLPKWARAHQAVNRVVRRDLELFKALSPESRARFERIIYLVWRMGYEAGKRDYCRAKRVKR